MAPRAQMAVAAVVASAVAVAVAIVVRTDTTGETGSGLGESFGYDLSALRRTDPALVKYAESARLQTGLREALAIAVDGADRVYVAGDTAVRALVREGEATREIALGAPPRALAVGPDGKVYVAMRDHVEVHDPAGVASPSVWASLGAGAVITSIALSADGVFVADAGNRVVLRFDVSGQLLNRIGQRDEAAGVEGFVVPSPYFDVAAGGDGFVFAANPGRHRIETYSYDGCFASSWGTASTGIEGFCGCCNPSHFAITPSGGFVTAEKGLPRVKEYAPDGAFVGVVAGPEVFAEGTVGLDLAVDSTGRVLVMDPVSREVRVFERTTPGGGAK